jgi:hypothetical protein
MCFAREKRKLSRVCDKQELINQKMEREKKRE